MESWQQILIAYPFLKTIWDSLIVCVPLAALLAYCGLFFISTTSKIIASSRKRSSFSKCARQTAFAGLIMGWLLLIGGRIWLYYYPAGGNDDINGFVQEVSWLLFSIGVLIISVYYSLWGVLKNMPVLHTTIGMIGSVQNIVALAAILCALRLTALTASPEIRSFSLPDLFPHTWNDPLYSAACYTIPLIFAMAGAVAGCWLIARRKKEDFGRDYYNTMIPWCCSWARGAWLLLWILVCVSTCLQFHDNWRNNLFNTEEAILDCARLLFWLLPPVLWTLVIRAKLPLRLNLITFLALIVACSFMLPYYLELTLI